MHDELGKILLRAGFINQPSLDRAINAQQVLGGTLSEQLLRMELITEDKLVRAWSAQYRVPAVTLDARQIPREALRFFPNGLCQELKMVCFRVDVAQRVLDVGFGDPANLQHVSRVQQFTDFSIRPAVVAPSVITAALARSVTTGRTDSVEVTVEPMALTQVTSEHFHITTDFPAQQDPDAASTQAIREMDVQIKTLGEALVKMKQSTEVALKALDERLRRIDDAQRQFNATFRALLQRMEVKHFLTDGEIDDILKRR